MINISNNFYMYISIANIMNFFIRVIIVLNLTLLILSLSLTNVSSK